jgi:hypothetical protein
VDACQPTRRHRRRENEKTEFHVPSGSMEIWRCRFAITNNSVPTDLNSSSASRSHIDSDQTMSGIGHSSARAIWTKTIELDGRIRKTKLLAGDDPKWAAA